MYDVCLSDPVGGYTPSVVLTACAWTASVLVSVLFKFTCVVSIILQDC